MELLWFKLGRPSYYSCIQGTGAQFFRTTAFEFQRRSDGLAGLDTQDFVGHVEIRVACAFKRDPDQNGPRSREQLATACRELPELDAIVLMTQVTGVTQTEWHAPAPDIVERDESVDRVDTFYMYRCGDLRPQ